MQHFLRIIKIIVSFMFMISDDPIIVSLIEQNVNCYRNMP